MMKTWLQPPRLRIGEDSEGERHATWLELFYDLVFVVAVSQLAHNLNDDVSLSGFCGFVVLFIPVWWSWIGTTLYANRFDTDDIVHRILTAMQMLAIAALAVNVHHGLAENAPGFALAYAAGRALLVFEYIRAGKHVSVARSLTNYYARGFAIAALLWLISAFVSPPLRFILWAFGLIIDFATPLTARKFITGLLPHAAHLPERFGLFTIIVLGEAIIAVVDGVSEQEWDIGSAIAAVFGLSIAFSLWWLYFDNIGVSAVQRARNEGRIAVLNAWLYTHLPLVIGIAATGVGVEQVLLTEANVALPTPQRWLLCGAVALCLLALAILHRTGTIVYCKIRTKYRLIAAVLVLLIGLIGVGWLPIVVIGSVAFVCGTQVIQDLRQSRPFTRLSDPE
ncbi:low temperature requirement protein A [Gloeocapsopsis sp. IPPAS B-1203]|uniref:low temperature requirement protein A n=1 Tax=Gloeocapsopsis sp. IPPAS B-1203 TaxID=2049454 RepID=UPI0025A2F4FD|nr:low temperature requirement protein A [Gloeocapsopsis sp. IPPAS B-1203]